MRFTGAGYTRDGKLHIELSVRLAMQEAVLLWPDGPVTISVERELATRSARANAYYWGAVVKTLADYTGYRAEEMHDILKMKFLSRPMAVARKNGTIVGEFVIGGSTRELDTSEFFDYIEAIRQWAFEELDVTIEPPDPEWRLKAADSPSPG